LDLQVACPDGAGPGAIVNLVEIGDRALDLGIGGVVNGAHGPAGMDHVNDHRNGIRRAAQCGGGPGARDGNIFRRSGQLWMLQDIVADGSFAGADILPVAGILFHLFIVDDVEAADSLGKRPLIA